jgi:maltose/maltodextrin transport system substrate-binding protein
LCWPHDRVGEWAKSGLVVPVRPAKALRAQIDDAAWQAFTYRGQTWGYPLAIEAIGLIYNKALVPRRRPASRGHRARQGSCKAQGKGAILWDYNKLLHLAAAGRAGRLCLRPHAAGRLRPEAGRRQHAGAVVGAQMLDRLIREGHMPKGARYSEMEGAVSRAARWR